LTDVGEATTDSYTYAAFGVLKRSTGSTPNNYLYTGEQFDPNSGFYYLRARYMNPELGRFVTTDPFSGLKNDPVTLHKYLYAGLDPVLNVDPSGEFFGGFGSLMGGLRIVTILSNISIGGFYTYGKLSGDKGLECWTKCMEKRTINGLISYATFVSELFPSIYKPLVGEKIPPNGSEFTSLIRKLSLATGGKLGTTKIANWIKRNPINTRIAQIFGKRRIPVTQGAINTVYYVASVYLFYNAIVCSFSG
jgi:RHS repeat-associated protein